MSTDAKRKREKSIYSQTFTKYLEIVKWSVRNVIIKLLHWIPRSIPHSNQNDWERIMAVFENATVNKTWTTQCNKSWIQMESPYLASTMESIVNCSCGLNLPGGVSGLLVTYIEYHIEKIKRRKNETQIWMNKALDKTCSMNLSICNNDKNMILPIAFLHNVNCSINYWGKWGWTYKRG